MLQELFSDVIMEQEPESIKNLFTNEETEANSGFFLFYAEAQSHEQNTPSIHS